MADLPDAMMHGEDGIEALVQASPFGLELDGDLHFDAVWTPRELRAWRIALRHAVDVGGRAASVAHADRQRNVSRFWRDGYRASARWPAQGRGELAGGASEHLLELEAALACPLADTRVPERAPQRRARTVERHRAQLLNLGRARAAPCRLGRTAAAGQSSLEHTERQGWRKEPE